LFEFSGSIVKSLFIICIALSSSFCSLLALGQESIALGLEQDVLPYVTGGYYFGAWAGKSHIRGRVLVAHVNKPEFIVPSGFTNNIVTAYALVGDYFLKSDWNGWWLSAGIVYWDSSIQRNVKVSTASYQNVLLNGSLGYNWKLGKNFYLSPWAGLHVRVGGATEVLVDGASFTTPLLNPEASLKLGWYFQSKK
jgi:hypothetical protein